MIAGIIGTIADDAILSFDSIRDDGRKLYGDYYLFVRQFGPEHNLYDPRIKMPSVILISL